ncbi:MAG: tetratricopeptide repeat protein [Saprospiraceae bacterium]|nr:tetratricopeptide repeat protein [Saprospiraceae bacterium]
MATLQHIEHQFEEAKSLHKNNSLPEAEVLYRGLMQLAPSWPEIPHLLGVLLGQKGEPLEAIHFLQRAITLAPTTPHYYHNLGRIYLALAKWDESIDAFRFALKLNAQYPEAWFGKGNALKGKSDLAGAIKAFEKALKMRPAYIDVLYNQGNTWMEMGHWRSARENFERCLQLEPDHAHAHNNLGSTLEYWEESDQAEVHYRQALQLAPDLLEARTNLVSLYEKEGRSDDCRNELRSVIQSASGHPNYQWWRWQYHQISEIIWQDQNQMESFRNCLLDQISANTRQPPQLVLADLHRLSIQPPFDLAYQGMDDLPLKKAYGRFFDNYFMQIRRGLGTDTHRPLRSGRRKVGFVVTRGHEGVFLKCIRGILQKLDTSLLEISVVCQAPNGRTILQPAIARDDIRYLEIPGRLDMAIHRIRAADFDILYYWEVGTDAVNYFLPFFRLAPVQCTSWGWPVTSGIPTMDYFLSCDLLETEESAQHYSEKLVLFKRLPVYYYPPALPSADLDRTIMGLPSDKRLYLCTQNLRKVHPDMDSLVAGILQKDTEGVVIFLADKRRPITEKLQHRLSRALGQMSKRCIFMPRMREEDYLRILTLVDVIIDTPHYTGGANTAYDAFATGTPYVTLPSRYHRGRYGMAAYRQLGMTDLVAHSPEEYVEQAIRVASDISYRTDIRSRIANGHKNIFEDELAVQELQHFFQTVQTPGPDDRQKSHEHPIYKPG